MDTHLSNVSVAGPERPKAAVIEPGQEKFTFIYVVISAAAVTCAIAYSLFAGLAFWQGFLLVIGSLLVACAFVFILMEMRRASRKAKTRAGEATNEDANLYASRAVSVAPPTGEPYPHHEDFAESAGFDQGQLTARIPGSTPFIDKLNRPHGKQKVER